MAADDTNATTVCSRAMGFAALIVSCWLGLAQPAASPRVVLHAQLHSFAAFEALVDELYAAQGFGAVYRSADRFASVRTLLGVDSGDRPCAVALVADATGAAHWIGIAPDALHDHALDRPRAHGGDPGLHAFVEAEATRWNWLTAAADDDVAIRVFVDVVAVREVWGDDLASFAAMARSAAALRAMLRQSSPLIEQAVEVLDRSVCTLDAWSTLEGSLDVRGGRWVAALTLVPESGSAAEHALRTWQPARVPATRIAFEGADLQGCIGASDVDAHTLLCAAFPEDATSASHAELERFARVGGVFAFGLEPDRVGVLLPYGEHPVGDPAWPAPWRAVAVRCMSPLAAGDDVGSTMLYARVRPAGWLQCLYDRADPRLQVPARAVDGWVDVRGTARGGALRLEIEADGAAMAAVVPCLRLP